MSETWVTEVTSTIESPLRATTAPEACFASLPVSKVRVRPPTSTDLLTMFTRSSGLPHDVFRTVGRWERTDLDVRVAPGHHAPRRPAGPDDDDHQAVGGS